MATSCAYLIVLVAEHSINISAIIVNFINFWIQVMRVWRIEASTLIRRIYFFIIVP